jgi:hypothetical protein
VISDEIMSAALLQLFIKKYKLYQISYPEAAGGVDSLDCMCLRPCASGETKEGKPGKNWTIRKRTGGGQVPGSMAELRQGGLVRLQVTEPARPGKGESNFYAA